MDQNGSYAGVKTMPHRKVEDQENEWLLRRATMVAANSARLAARIAAAEERKMPGQHENGGARGGSKASRKSSGAPSNQAVLSELQGAQEPRRLCPSFQGQQSEIANVIVRNAEGSVLPSCHGILDGRRPEDVDLEAQKGRPRTQRLINTEMSSDFEDRRRKWAETADHFRGTKQFRSNAVQWTSGDDGDRLERTPEGVLEVCSCLFSLETVVNAGGRRMEAAEAMVSQDANADAIAIDCARQASQVLKDRSKEVDAQKCTSASVFKRLESLEKRQTNHAARIGRQMAELTPTIAALELRVAEATANLGARPEEASPPGEGDALHLGAVLYFVLFRPLFCLFLGFLGDLG